MDVILQAIAFLRGYINFLENEGMDTIDIFAGWAIIDSSDIKLETLESVLDLLEEGI